MTSHPQRPWPAARRDGAHGFTLVEVLIVVVVLGILSGVAVLGVGRFRGDTRASACLADAAAVAVAADAYDATTGTFPTSVAQLVDGQYLRSAPTGGIYTFDASTKTATRVPECARDDEGRYVTGLGGKCMDLGSTAPADGTAVEIRTCDGRATQRWTAPASWPGAVMVLGKCLDVEADGTGNFTPVQLRTCDGSESQQWVLEPGARLRSQPAGRCMDVAYGNGDDGAFLILWDCHQGENQQWVFA